MRLTLLHADPGTRGHRRLLLPGLLERLVDAEAGRPLPRRELLKRREELPDDGLGGHEQERPIGLPLVVEHRTVLITALERIGPEVVQLRASQRDGRLDQTASP